MPLKEEEALCRGSSSDLGCQARFADPGFAGDQGRLSPSTFRRIHQRMEGHQLPCAADQHRAENWLVVGNGHGMRLLQLGRHCGAIRSAGVRHGSGQLRSEYIPIHIGCSLRACNLLNLVLEVPLRVANIQQHPILRIIPHDLRQAVERLREKGVQVVNELPRRVPVQGMPCRRVDYDRSMRNLRRQ